MTENEKLTLFIAGYAAIVSTMVLLWDIYKWKTSGVKLHARGAMGMIMVGDPSFDGAKLVTVTVTNQGNAPTTITGMGFLLYKNRWHAVFRPQNPVISFIVPEPSDAQIPPFKLNPGEQWMGLARQSDELVDMARDGYLVVTVFSSIGGDVRARLIPNPPGDPA